jgi:hypothetical protein
MIRAAAQHRPTESVAGSAKASPCSIPERTDEASALRATENQAGSGRVKLDQGGKKTSGGTLDDLAGKVFLVWKLRLQSRHAK